VQQDQEEQGMLLQVRCGGTKESLEDKVWIKHNGNTRTVGEGVMEGRHFRWSSFAPFCIRREIVQITI
jgi:hypothetical protein